VLLESGDQIYLETVLHYAAQYGHDKVVKLLDENGANADAENIWERQNWQSSSDIVMPRSC